MIWRFPGFALAVPLLALAVVVSSAPAGAAQCDGASDERVAEAVSRFSKDRDGHVIADWALTTGIRDLCPLDRLDGDVASGRSLTVWMRAAGNDKALQRLRTERRLPLRHVWALNAGTRWRVVDVVNVTGNATSDTSVDGFTRETNNRGFFDWRTFSTKENIRRGYWRVTIIDRLGDPVPCHDTGAPCEIEFNVR